MIITLSFAAPLRLRGSSPTAELPRSLRCGAHRLAQSRPQAAGLQLVEPRDGRSSRCRDAISQHGGMLSRVPDELRGAEQVAHELIRAAIAAVFEQYFDHNSLQQLVQYFELGGALKLSEEARSEELLKQLRKIQGLVESTSHLGFKPKDKPGLLVAGCEFVLEGLYAHRKINRSEERGFYAEEPPRPEPEPRQPVPRPRRSYQ